MCQSFILTRIEVYSRRKFAFPACLTSTSITTQRFTEWLIYRHEIPHSTALNQQTGFTAKWMPHNLEASGLTWMPRCLPKELPWHLRGTVLCEDGMSFCRMWYSHPISALNWKNTRGWEQSNRYRRDTVYHHSQRCVSSVGLEVWVQRGYALTKGHKKSPI